MENERIIEILIIKDYLKLYKNILEIGNVLNHYYKCNHTVIDKYEIGDNIINCDVLNPPCFPSCSMFDLIISISTL
jgi:hypothetical protein